MCFAREFLVSVWTIGAIKNGRFLMVQIKTFTLITTELSIKSIDFSFCYTLRLGIGSSQEGNLAGTYQSHDSQSKARILYKTVSPA